MRAGCLADFMRLGFLGRYCHHERRGSTAEITEVDSTVAVASDRVSFTCRDVRL